MSFDVSVDDLVSLGLTDGQARDLRGRLGRLPAGLSPAETWDEVANSILYPEHPFAIHKFLFQQVYSGSDPSLGPPAAWLPPRTSDGMDSNIHRLCDRVGVDSVEALHAWSVGDRPAFWQTMIEAKNPVIAVR